MKKYQIEEDGSIIDSDGFYHPDKLSYLEDMLGFCGCGYPVSALQFVSKLLELIDGRFENHKFQDDIDTLSGNNIGLEYLLFYFLEDKELTEHGTSIPGWLTEYGKEFLQELKLALNKVE